LLEAGRPSMASKPVGPTKGSYPYRDRPVIAGRYEPMSDIIAQVRAGLPRLKPWFTLICSRHWVPFGIRLRQGLTGTLRKEATCVDRLCVEFTSSPSPTTDERSIGRYQLCDQRPCIPFENSFRLIQR